MEIKPIIREARPEDLHQIQKLLNWAIAETTAIYDYDQRSMQQIEAWYDVKLQSGFPVLVLATDEVLIGFASYGTFRPWQGFHRTVEHSIYVFPEFHGKGYGKLLLKAIVDKARENKLHAIIGGIDASNKSSIKLHEQLGFEQVGMLPQVGFKFDKYLDLAFLQLILV